MKNKNLVEVINRLKDENLNVYECVNINCNTSINYINMNLENFIEV